MKNRQTAIFKDSNPKFIISKLGGALRDLTKREMTQSEKLCYI